MFPLKPIAGWIITLIILAAAVYGADQFFDWGLFPNKNRESSPSRVTFGNILLPEVTMAANPAERSLATVISQLPKPSIIDGRGDAAALSLGLSKYWATDTFDYRVVAKFRSFGKARYCERLKVLGVTLEKGTFVVKTIDLYGALAQKDLQDPQNIQVRGVNEHLRQGSENVWETVNSAEIIITIDSIGILEPASTIGSTVKFSIKEDGKLGEIVIDSLSKFYVDSPISPILGDKVDRRAHALAEADGVSPLASDGSRSTFKLDLLFEAMEKSLTTSSGDPEKPNAYDNLLQDAKRLAREHGFQEVESFRVVIKKPVTLKDWVYIEDGSPVIPTHVEKLHLDSSCRVVPEHAWLEQLPADWKTSIPPEVFDYLYK